MRESGSQQGRLFLVVALACVPLAVFATVALVQLRATEEQRVARDREALARATALTVEAFIEGNLAILRTVATSPQLTNPETPDLAERIARVLAQNPAWQSLALIDRNGWNIVGGLGSEPYTISIADRPYFQRALATGQPTVSEGVIGRASGLPSLILAVPIRFPDGEPGVLIAPLPLERLGERLRAQVGSETARVVLFDRAQQTLVHPDAERGRTLAPPRALEEAALAQQGKSGWKVRDIEGTRSLVTYAPVSELGGGILIAEPTSEAFAHAQQAFTTGLALLGLALASTWGMAWFLGGRLSLLYSRLVEALRRAEDARADAEEARRRAAFLAAASQRLESALDEAVTPTVATELVVPELADACFVDVVDREGGIRRLATAHADPAKAEAARALLRYPPAPGSPSMSATAIRTGQPQLLQQEPADWVTSLAQDDEHLQILRALDLRSIIALPLRSRGRVVGSITLGAGAERGAYDERDLAFATDLADRIALAVDNAQLQADLQRALEARDEFLGAASHDLRSPLTPIIAGVQLLRRILERDGNIDPGRLREVLNQMDISGQRMNALVGTMLDVSRLEFGEPLDLERRPTELVRLVRTVVAEYEPLTEKHHIRVEAGGDVIGLWDAARLERIVRNLLDNAVKYSPHGGEVLVTVETDSTGREPTALLSVRDQGVGIPEADLPLVFERFRRASNVVGTFSGTGIGLSSARQVVEQHGGTIHVDSRLGEGTVITVRLPVGLEAASEEPTAALPATP